MAAAVGFVTVLGLEEILGELWGMSPVWSVEISQSRLCVTGWGCGRVWKKGGGSVQNPQLGPRARLRMRRPRRSFYERVPPSSSGASSEGFGA
jgi:hypothetical protein